MGESADDFFNSLFEVVNHVPFGSKDGLEDPPVQQLSNQSAGTEEISLAVNKGGADSPGSSVRQPLHRRLRLVEL